MPLVLMPLAWASAVKAFFQTSKPVEVLPHLAAFATPAVIIIATAIAASVLNVFVAIAVTILSHFSATAPLSFDMTPRVDETPPVSANILKLTGVQ
jgi:hypothetical protein